MCLLLISVLFYLQQELVANWTILIISHMATILLSSALLLGWTSVHPTVLSQYELQPEQNSWYDCQTGTLNLCTHRIFLQMENC